MTQTLPEGRIARVHRPRRPTEAAGGPVTSLDLGPMTLESGGRLERVRAAYRHDGPSPAQAPQVLVIHALTGSADAAGDWWAPVIGPGAALDTSSAGVLCVNLLGGCYGTTGPTSIDDASGRRFGSSFPAITTRDQAALLWRVTDRLAIPGFDLVVGGSLGGMVALEVALQRPAAVRVVAPIAAPAATGALALAWDHLQLELVDRLGDDGLELARALALTTYRSEADFDGRFGRAVGTDERFAIASYLGHQGRKLRDRFDVDTYRTLVRAMDAHDIGRDRGGEAAALASLARAGTRLHGVGIEGDILYGPGQVRALVATAQRVGVTVRYEEIRSSKGHDAFLVEWDQLDPILRAAGSATLDGGATTVSSTPRDAELVRLPSSGAAPAVWRRLREAILGAATTTDRVAETSRRIEDLMAARRAAGDVASPGFFGGPGTPGDAIAAQALLIAKDEPDPVRRAELAAIVAAAAFDPALDVAATLARVRGAGSGDGRERGPT